tara:strand:+ start:146 stop:334 length:189 start_codon:yes stop_codon:yes gene_type:complete
MKELYFFPRVKMNARIIDSVIDGSHIVLEDYTYDMLSKKPRGRSIDRTLINEDLQTRITIYK